MNRCVLIIDDDQGFAELLKGIFEQADYAVRTVFNAESGLEVLQRETIDLIVTDQRLPGGLSGIEFVSRIRERGIDLPVIMVSGYLDDHSIRDLIRDGVAGVFIKPLNIFSLLKKASEVMERRSKERKKQEVALASEEDNPPVAGSIGRIEGHSEAGKTFLHRAHEAAGFRRNLLLIGPPGTLFEEIAHDMIGLDEEPESCVTLKPGQATSETLESYFQGENATRRLALILLQAEHLSREEVSALMRLAEEHGGVGGHLRMVFCLSRSVEDLYDSGALDEEFYLFLGTNELKVPPLRDMPEDLVAMARKEIQEHCREAAIDVKLRAFLLAHDWPENMLELRSVIVRAITHAQPRPPQLRHFEAALSPAVPEEPAEASHSSLERFLKLEMARYQQAREILIEN